MSRSESTQLFAIVLLGVAIRFAFLLWAAPLELWADEGQYVYQALAWNRFGFYLGSPDWVWPPGYPAYVGLFLRAFGEDGIFAAKLGQVLLSSVVGGSVVLLARRLFSPRAARIAGLLWAGYLPLIGFTHFLWPETLFLAALLPAVLFFVTALEGEPHAPSRLVLAGALLGLACLFKEAPLPLLLLLPLVLLTTRRDLPVAERAGLAAVLVLSACAVLVPWSLRTFEVYGRVVPSGATLGENLYQGVNAHYVNYDYAGAPAIETVDESSYVYRWFVRPPDGVEPWTRSGAPSAVVRNSENTALAKRFALDHPGFFVRSRIKKVADWLTPLNFFQRHERLGIYEGSLASTWVRRPLVLASVALTCLVLAGGIGGLFLAARGRTRAVFSAVILTFLAGAAVVSMSRYRVQVEPFLIVLTAGFLTRERSAPSRASLALAGAGWMLLALSWTINSSEILSMLRRSM